MASLQNIKKRLKGVKNIGQMTQAMELVAATKMRRAQEAALSSRPYALTALELLANLQQAAQVFEEEGQVRLADFPLISPREVKTTAILLVASDKGLAGSFNGSVFRQFEKFLAQEGTTGEKFRYIAVGQKAHDYLKRKKLPLEAYLTRLGDAARLEDVEPIAAILREGYEKGAWDRVVSFSTNFLSALRQEVAMRQLLPIEFKRIRESVEEIIPKTGRYAQLRKQIVESRTEKATDYIVEPSPREALERLIPLLFTMQVYHLMLEANASEHSARRMAMKNATDNAHELTSNLTLAYNRQRQTLVTREVIEITSTTSAMK